MLKRVYYNKKWYSVNQVGNQQRFTRSERLPPKWWNTHQGHQHKTDWSQGYQITHYKTTNY